MATVKWTKIHKVFIIYLLYSPLYIRTYSHLLQVVDLSTDITGRNLLQRSFLRFYLLRYGVSVNTEFYNSYTLSPELNVVKRNDGGVKKG